MEALEADFRQSVPAVGMGFTKARVEDYRRPLSLDIRKIATHIDSLVRFSYVQPAIKDVLDAARPGAGGADERHRPGDGRGHDPAVADARRAPAGRAAGHGPDDRPVPMHGAHPHRHVDDVPDPSNATQQLTGWFPAALKVKPSYLQGALNRYLQAPRQVAAEIAQLSKFMDNRFSNQLFELTDAINDIAVNPNKFQKLQKWAAPLLAAQHQLGTALTGNTTNSARFSDMLGRRASTRIPEICKRYRQNEGRWQRHKATGLRSAHQPANQVSTSTVLGILNPM